MAASTFLDYIPRNINFSALEPGGPDAYALARAASAAWAKAEEAKWTKEHRKNYNERLTAEFERLVLAFVGAEGLSPKAWTTMTRKLELMAGRQIQRQETLELLQYRTNHLEAPEIKAAALQQITACIIAARKYSAAEQVEGSEGGRGARESLDPMRWSGNRLQVNSSPNRYSAGHESLLQRMPVATDPSGSQRNRPLSGGGGVTSMNESSTGPQPAMFQPGRPPSTSHRVSIAGTRSLSGLRSSMHILQAKRQKMSPLCRKLFDVCVALNVPSKTELIDVIEVSELSGEMRIVGVSLQLGAAEALAAILPVCCHISGLHISRTLMLPDNANKLLSAACVLPLKSLELVGTDLQGESLKHLVSALQRPTATRALPIVMQQPQKQVADPLPGSPGPRRVRLGEYAKPQDPFVSAIQPPESQLSATPRPLGPNLWCSLEALDLSGNSIGDQGLQLLHPHLCSLMRLSRLTMRQAGLTDWSAPQIGMLMMQMSGRLVELDLSSNQLGPLAAEAIGAALPSCSLLRILCLAWNGLGGGSQHIAWALAGLRMGKEGGGQAGISSSSSLTRMDLSGTSPSAEALMALAAMLRFGNKLPLRHLDLSFNDLVGVGAQCLLRQMNSRLDPPLSQQTLMEAQAQRAAARAVAFSDEDSEHDGKSEEGDAGGGTIGLAGGRLGGTVIDFSTKGCKICESDPLAAAQLAQEPSPRGMARVRAAPRSQGTSAQTPVPDLVSVSGAVTWRQRRAMATFSLDLSRRLPDRMIARLLVEHEVQARTKHWAAWYSMTLNDTQHRKDGIERVPFDVVYEGWLSEDSLPDTGKLLLQVLPLHDSECPWLQNEAFQAVQMMIASRKS